MPVYQWRCSSVRLLEIANPSAWLSIPTRKNLFLMGHPWTVGNYTGEANQTAQWKSLAHWLIGLIWCGDWLLSNFTLINTICEGTWMTVVGACIHCFPRIQIKMKHNLTRKKSWEPVARQGVVIDLEFLFYMAKKWLQSMLEISKLVVLMWNLRLEQLICQQS